MKYKLHAEPYTCYMVCTAANYCLYLCHAGILSNPTFRMIIYTYKKKGAHDASFIILYYSIRHTISLSF